MKKWSVITIAALLLSGAAALAGVFQYCTAMPNGGATNDFCSTAYGGGCAGYCNEYVVTGKMKCQNSINPYCGGTSYQLIREYSGGCEGDDCHCVIDYSSSSQQAIPNECD